MASLLKLTNNAIGRLNASITTSSTTIQLVPGQGAKFPSLGAGEFFPCTLIAAAGTLEIVKVTARSGDNLTVLRAQEGTTASAFAISDRCELRLTGGAMQGELDRIAGIADGYASAIAAALPKAGGPMSGNIVFNNGVGLYGKDSDGTLHQILNLGADNNVNCVIGIGGHWRFYSPDGVFTMVDIDASGNIYAAGGVTLANNFPLASKDVDGTVRPITYMAGNTVVNRVAGGTAISWYNQAGDTQIASLNNAGDYSCKTLTTTSDEDKKTNWQPLPDAVLDRLAEMVLAGFFDWIDGSGSSLGGSAQELRRIGLGVAVAEDAEGNLSVNYSALSFVIVQAMLRREKVSKADIEQRLTALESK